MLPDLVVAHYDEKLNWLDELSALARPVVYDKAAPDPRRPGRGLPNVGREAHTYLTYVTDHYDRLPDWVVFVQGDPSPHLQNAGVTVKDLLLAGGPGTFACPWAVTARDWGGDGRLDWQRFAFGSPAARAFAAGEMRRAALPFPQWFHDNVRRDEDVAAGVTYTPGACFGVSSYLIRSRPLGYYRGLLAQLNHRTPEESHYLERSWWHVFGGWLKALSPKPEAERRRLTVDVAGYGVVYCAHPSYGPGVPASHEAFWAHDVHPHSPYAGVELSKNTQGSSLLADAFNWHWKRALNLQLAGTPVRRFVMLHDDVAPEAGWLNKLLAELDRTGADLLAAVVPLKDTRGLTSTALDDPDDPWEVYRRLSIKESLALPETFTAADCAAAGLAGKGAAGRALLPNTGLWACRFDRPWRHEVHFQIHNRIAFRVGEDWSGTVRVTPHLEAARSYKAGEVIPNADYAEGMVGEFVNQVMSEDWDFGRQLARLGCDVRCTTAVELSHFNSGVPFRNRDTGGEWETDLALARKWDDDPYAAVKGWLTPAEGRFLRELARGRDVLEVGSYCGKSTLWMAESAASVTAVDPHDGRGTPAPRDTHEEMLANLRHFGLRDKVSVFRGTSADFALRGPPGAGYDVAFIDGAHDYESVRDDIGVALKFLRPDRALCFHDYGAHDGVTRAVNELLGRPGFKKLAAHGSMCLVITPTRQKDARGNDR